ncbi:MAG: hypothetical protein ACR2JW_15705 [Thermomicrobiales bacterium]
MYRVFRHAARKKWQQGRDTSPWSTLAEFLITIRALAVPSRNAELAHDATMTKDAVFYDVMMQRIDQQFENADNADTKIATVLTVASLLLPVFGGLLAAEQDHIGRRTVQLAIAGGVAYLLVLALLFAAYIRDEFSARPDPTELATFVQNPAYNLGDIRFWIAVSCGESIAENEILLKKKARLTTSALIFVIVEFLLLTTAVLLSLGN